MTTSQATQAFTARRYLTLAAVVLLSVALVLFTQEVKLWTGHKATAVTVTTLAGLGSLWLFALAGIVIGDLTKLARIPLVGQFPVLGWVSLVSLTCCLAWDGFVQAIHGVDFLSLTTPILVFAGISVADRLVDLTKTSWKVAITAVFVFVGIYVGGATIAQLGLSV